VVERAALEAVGKKFVPASVYRALLRMPGKEPGQKAFFWKLDLSSFQPRAPFDPVPWDAHTYKTC